MQIIRLQRVCRLWYDEMVPKMLGTIKLPDTTLKRKIDLLLKSKPEICCKEIV